MALCRLGDEVLVPAENLMLLERRSVSGLLEPAVVKGGGLPEVSTGLLDAILVDRCCPAQGQLRAPVDVCAKSGRTPHQTLARSVVVKA